MAKNLSISFLTDTGSRFSLNVPEVRDDLTALEVRALMDKILEKKIFETKSGELVMLDKASIVTRTSEELVL